MNPLVGILLCALGVAALCFGLAWHETTKLNREDRWRETHR